MKEKKIYTKLNQSNHVVILSGSTSEQCKEKKNRAPANETRARQMVTEKSYSLCGLPLTSSVGEPLEKGVKLPRLESR